MTQIGLRSNDNVCWTTCECEIESVFHRNHDMASSAAYCVASCVSC